MTSLVDGPQCTGDTILTDPKTIGRLTCNWIWVSGWIDSSTDNTAGRLVTFTRNVRITSPVSAAVLHFSADTRYKLFVNGHRVAVGPARSSPLLWYYDTLDIAKYLTNGEIEIKFVVVRYFAASRSAMHFQRTAYPGLTVVGDIQTNEGSLRLDSAQGWLAQEDRSMTFPTGLVDDVFLHINERRTLDTTSFALVNPKPYNIKTLNGELSPWRLRPRPFPMVEQSSVDCSTVRKIQSSKTADAWSSCLSNKTPLLLAAKSSHELELQAAVHSTAFLRWKFVATSDTQITLKCLYSEGYEAEPRAYPFLRIKKDRLDAEHGKLIGPFDQVTFETQAGRICVYEPFWFRTFRILKLEIDVGSGAVELSEFEAMQANYPIVTKGSFEQIDDPQSKLIWDVSVRTLRNCMFDGYSDCPFYEQLQYVGDSRTVGIFHYLISGDDRLMRQTISSFAASVTVDGLTQSRFPSHVPQIIAGFSLIWILQVCDHHLYFGDTAFSRTFLPKIDGVLDYFACHVDDRGLVSGLPDDVWQFVDWVTTWEATESHADKGVPTSGRNTNCHTYFSMLYAMVLKDATRLLRDVNRPALAAEYEDRATSIVDAIRRHCYDGKFFTDSTVDVADELSYSQHCQVFGVLSGAALSEDTGRLLKDSFGNPKFSKCSYMMMFYAFRAFATAGDEVYEGFWPDVLDPWRKMLGNNMTTWEEDDVRQRSDCHAWGSVPIYEYCTEIAGVKPTMAGCKAILFRPRLKLSAQIHARVALGTNNIADVSWHTDPQSGKKTVELRMAQAIEVTSQLPGEDEVVTHGTVDVLCLDWAPPR